MNERSVRSKLMDAGFTADEAEERIDAMLDQEQNDTRPSPDRERERSVVDRMTAQAFANLHRHIAKITHDHHRAFAERCCFYDIRNMFDRDGRALFGRSTTVGGRVVSTPEWHTPGRLL